MIEERPDVAIQDMVHLGAGDPDHQRVVLAAPGPEAVREPEEVLLVDRVQHRHRRLLDDLVLQGGDPPGAAPGRPAWGCTVAGTAGPGTLPGGPARAAPRSGDRGPPRRSAKSARPRRGRRRA